VGCAISDFGCRIADCGLRIADLGCLMSGLEMKKVEQKAWKKLPRNGHSIAHEEKYNQ